VLQPPLAQSAWVPHAGRQVAGLASQPSSGPQLSQ